MTRPCDPVTGKSGPTRSASSARTMAARNGSSARPSSPGASHRSSHPWPARACWYSGSKPLPSTRSRASTSSVRCSSMNGRTWSSRNASSSSSSSIRLKSIACPPAQTPGAYRRSPSAREVVVRITGDEAPALRPPEVQLHVRFEGEPEAALHMDAGARGAVRHVARVQVRHQHLGRRFGRFVLAEPRGTLVHPTTALDPDRHVDERVGDGLERTDRHAECVALVRVLDREVERALRDAGLRRGHEELPLRHRVRQERFGARAVHEHATREEAAPESVLQPTGAPARLATGAGRSSVSTATSTPSSTPTTMSATAPALTSCRSPALTLRNATAATFAPLVITSSSSPARVGGGEEASGRDHVDHRGGRDPESELLGDQHQLDRAGAVTAGRLGEAHGDHTGGDQLLPERGVVTEGLGGADAGRRALLLEEAGEHLPQLVLLP